MRIIIAITGASGAIYGIKILEACKENNIESHLIISKWAESTIVEETGYTVNQVRELANFYYDDQDLAAQVSSGSFKWDGMIVAPCSMKTLAAIANGFTDTLVVRTADVALKERRKLLLMVRETPLSPIHLENMLKLSRLGVVIMPPVPAFYTKPETVEEIVTQTVGRALDSFDIEIEGLKRWRSQ